MKIKIWLVNHYATEMYKNKAGRHYWFAKELLKRGYEPTIICANAYHNSYNYEDTGREKYVVKSANEVPFVFIKTGSAVSNGLDRMFSMTRFSLNLFLASDNLIKSFGKPDVILASSVHPLTWLAGYLIAKKYNIKFIAETRDLWPETFVAMGAMKKNCLIAKALYKLEKFIYRRADSLIFTMAGGRDYLKEIGLNNQNVHHINNGIDLELYNKNLKDYTYDDADLSNSELFKIIYTGTISKANLIGDIVEVAKVFNEKGPHNIKFIIFGDGHEKQFLEKYAQNNQLTNIVFKGKVDKKYIPGILAKSDLNIFTGRKLCLYKFGLSPNKMFDYLASGKPIISNIECGFDLLEKYRCGITVQSGSPVELVNGILRFYNMPSEEYERYAKNAVKAAKDHVFKAHTDKLERIIKDLLQ